MKNGVWIGGLILSLSGWTTHLCAQETAWRPALSGPVPATLAPTDLKPCPQATIGRPIPVIDEPTFLPVPPASAILRASYQPALFPAGSAAPTAKEIPGGNKLPTWEEVDNEAPPFTTDGSFAADRVQPLPALPVPSGTKQVGPAATLPSNGPLVPPPPKPSATAIKQVGLAAPGPFNAPDAPPPPSSSAWGTSMPTMLPALPESVNGNPYPYPYPLATGDAVPKSQVQFGDAPNQLNPMSSHFYASGEYLLWWTKKDTAPALVSTSTDGSGVNNRFGFLNQPSTTVLFGGPYGGDASSGFRGNVGYWLDTWCEEAVELGGFFLAPRTGNFSASSDQYSILARPFFNANSNQEFAELVAFPGISTGHVVVSTPSSLWGIDSNLRCNVCLACDYRFDLLAGFRYLNLYEGLNIAEFVQGEAGAPAPFTNALTTVNDSFTTHNQFYGGQIGFDSEWKYGAWSFDVKGKLALGATQQQLNINGIETITPSGGATSTYNGGLLALPSNIGSHNKTEFSVVPEVGLTLGYQLTNNVRLYAGYNFLYWTHVIRPGQQIDRNLDVTQIPNFNIPGSTPTAQANPIVPFKQTDYWAQGIMVGIEIRY